MDKYGQNERHMDKLSNSEEAKKFLHRLGVQIDETKVRQVVNVISGYDHRSLYSLYIERPNKPAPIVGKGTAYKIKRLYKGGELGPYLDYIAQREAGLVVQAGYIAYSETPHRQKMRKLAKDLAVAVCLPLKYASFVDPRIPGDWFIGEMFKINISEAGEIKPVLETESEQDLYEALLNHLRIGGFNDVIENLTSWKHECGEILVEYHQLFDVIWQDASERYGITSSFDYEEAGFAIEFFDTITASAILGFYKDTLYHVEKGILQWGMYKIYYGSPDDDFEVYKNIHSELIAKYHENDLAKQIEGQFGKLRQTEQYMKNQLIKFSDMEQLPGRCDLCSVLVDIGHF